VYESWSAQTCIHLFLHFSNPPIFARHQTLHSPPHFLGSPKMLIVLYRRINSLMLWQSQRVGVLCQMHCLYDERDGVLFERVKVGTASSATPDANCSKTIAMCKACTCNVPTPIECAPIWLYYYVG
jgi:hypothetical protein